MTLSARSLRAARMGAALAAGAATWAFAGETGAPKGPRVAPETQTARVELGRRLFFDPAASRTGRVACAQCHDPGHGFSDRAHPSQDEFGPSARRSMPVTDLPDGPMHSDGEFKDVRELLAARLVPLDELDNADRVEAFGSFGLRFSVYGNLAGGRPGLVPVAQRVDQGRLYAPAFEAAFGDPVPSTDRVIDALHAYVMSLRTEKNPLDRFLAGEEDALPVAARRGLALFTGKAECATCHVTTPVDGRAPLRDGLFHDTGISWRTAKAQGSDDPARDADQGLGTHGRRAIDRRREKMRFKTPSLRDVSRRAPFMHDGSIATLADVIEYYDKGGARHAGIDSALRPLSLTPEEKDDLLSFLFALSSSERAGLGQAPSPTPRSTRVRIVDPEGRPVAGAAVGVEPEGDRFRGGAAEPAALRTDKDGRITFEFPDCTHVRLRVEGHGAAGGRLLPDCAREAELVAVPQDAVALRVAAGADGLPRLVQAVPVQTVDDRGRPVLAREGDTVTFTLSRAISTTEGIYVARLGNAERGSARRSLVPRGVSGAAPVVQADIDFAGGALTFVDLRPPPPGVRTEDPDNRR